MLLYLCLSLPVLNIRRVPAKRSKRGNDRHKISIVDNLLLKDALKKGIFYKPTLNMKVSVSEILLVIQRVKRRVCVRQI